MQDSIKKPLHIFFIGVAILTASASASLSFAMDDKVGTSQCSTAATIINNQNSQIIYSDDVNLTDDQQYADFQNKLNIINCNIKLNHMNPVQVLSQNPKLDENTKNIVLKLKQFHDNFNYISTELKNNLDSAHNCSDELDTNYLIYKKKFFELYNLCVNNINLFNENISTIIEYPKFTKLNALNDNHFGKIYRFFTNFNNNLPKTNMADDTARKQYESEIKYIKKYVTGDSNFLDSDIEKIIRYLDSYRNKISNNDYFANKSKNKHMAPNLKWNCYDENLAQLKQLVRQIRCNLFSNSLIQLLNNAFDNNIIADLPEKTSATSSIADQTEAPLLSEKIKFHQMFRAKYFVTFQQLMLMHTKIHDNLNAIQQHISH